MFVCTCRVQLGQTVLSIIGTIMTRLWCQMLMEPSLGTTHTHTHTHMHSLSISLSPFILSTPPPPPPPPPNSLRSDVAGQVLPFLGRDWTQNGVVRGYNIMNQKLIVVCYKFLTLFRLSCSILWRRTAIK